MTNCYLPQGISTGPLSTAKAGPPVTIQGFPEPDTYFQIFINNNTVTSCYLPQRIIGINFAANPRSAKVLSCYSCKHLELPVLQKEIILDLMCKDNISNVAQYGANSWNLTTVQRHNIVKWNQKCFPHSQVTDVSVHFCLKALYTLYIHTNYISHASLSYL